MNGESFWYCIKAIASAFDGNGTWSDETIRDLARHAMAMEEERRESLRRDITVIAGGLSKLDQQLRSQTES